MQSFWKELSRPFFVLAPMEAVTDVVFRHVVRKAGEMAGEPGKPDIFMTEFTNATGWAHAGDKAIGGRLAKTSDEEIIVAQLWGSDPSAMEKLAKHCAQLGYHGIDINMGCPDSSAIKGGGGAQMIRTPEVAYDMIKAAKESGLPVSVKTRLGYSYVNEWPEWLAGLLNQDIENLTIHLRTKKEMSKVPAHFELIPEIKALRDQVSPDTPLTINGDITNREHGLALVRETGVDGVMIGRGIFQSPFAFALEKPLGNDKLIELMRLHLSLYDEYQHLTRRPYETLKRFYKIYVRDFNGASELRDKLMHTKTTAEARQILDNLQISDL